MASRDSDPWLSSEGEQSPEAALRERVTGLVRQGEAGPDVNALFAGLQHQIEHERGVLPWLRSRSTRVRIALAATSVLLFVVAVVLGWPRPDRSVYPVLRMALGLLLILGLLGLQLALALRPLARPALRPWVSPAAIAGALLGLWLLYALPAAHLAHPASLQDPGWQALLTRALPCLRFGLLLALASYALLRALDRGGVGRGLLFAAYGGLVANLVLLLHCPVTAPSHLLLGHLGVAVLLVLAVAGARQATTARR
jgi:hypothetical protein